MATNNFFNTNSTLKELDSVYREIKGSAEVDEESVSIAVISNFSTQHLVRSLSVCIHKSGFQPRIYESGYNQWEFELQNENSNLRKGGFDYVLILLSSTMLQFHPRANSPADFASYLKSLLQQFRRQSSAKFIYMLPESTQNEMDQTSIFYEWRKDLIKELNSNLGDLVEFLDIEPLICAFGSQRWYSNRFLVTAKLPFHPNCSPYFGDYITKHLLALRNRPSRLVVVDLDNTLWGGEVGDLGWENVDLDSEGKGYAYLMLQRYLLGLSKKGVLLAVCSKNTLEIAMEVFENRKEMILSKKEFVDFQINWEPKSINIKRILKKLNMTESGVVFLDDSEFERREVESNLSGIFVPDLAGDPMNWTEGLARSGALMTPTVGEEDLNRAEMYKAEAKRQEESRSFEQYDSFLEGLELTMKPRAVDRSNIDRVESLFQKTNQFNLTTRRYSRSDLERYYSTVGNYFFCFELEDKYSSYGIVGVLLALPGSHGMTIDSWLLSCRVMSRTMEYAMFDHFRETVMEAGADRIIGEYIPTKKNGPVSGLLPDLGFCEIDESAGLFELGAGRRPEKVSHFVRIES